MMDKTAALSQTHHPSSSLKHQTQHGTSTATFMTSASDSNLTDFPPSVPLYQSLSLEDGHDDGLYLASFSSGSHEYDDTTIDDNPTTKHQNKQSTSMKTTLYYNNPKQIASLVAAYGGNIHSSHATSHAYVLKDASRSEIMTYLHHRREKEGGKLLKVSIAFHDLSVWTMASTKPTITTVGSALLSMITCGLANDSKNIKERIDILKSVSGELKPHSMTLLLGPPGCGRSLLMKLLSNRLNGSFLSKDFELEGAITFNGDHLAFRRHDQTGRFIPGKVVDYVEQIDSHAPLLTVEETLRYAWMCTAEHINGKVDEEDGKIAIQNILTILGLTGCKDTLVGDESTRGISGGEKRRLTLGEMLLTPRPVKIMDSITDGLDAATAYDIMRYLRDSCTMLGHTYLISLHQPSPPIYDLFDEVIVMSEGKIIYQGLRCLVKPYFESLGFICPEETDDVEFIQELSTPEGGLRFYRGHQEHDKHDQNKPRYENKTIPHSEYLANCWQESSMYQSMKMDMKQSIKSLSVKEPNLEDENEKFVSFSWPQTCTTTYQPNVSWWFYLSITLEKYFLIEKRSKAFYFVRLYPTVIVSVLVGTIYQGIGMTDIFTMTGFLFFNIMVPAMGQFSMMPRIYAHKHWHYKFSDALFYPSVSVFNIAQSLFAYPLFTIETFLGCLIQYWIVGLSADNYGARFAFFILVTLLFTLVITKCFRLLSVIFADCEVAVAMGGVMMLFLSLFSGFIQPINATPIYWKWFFYINPCAWSLTAISINEYKSSRYDEEMCTSITCDEKKRFGDIALEQYGNPTETGYEWFCVLILIVMYIVLILANDFLLRWKRSVPTPALPVREETFVLETSVAIDELSLEMTEMAGRSNESPHHMLSLPFDPITMTFKCVEYRVPGSEKGTELTLLSKVDGYFEPGTMTALMGSTGAGKTTLMDVLAARKNQGTCFGDIQINGKGIGSAKSQFKSIMAYVEQFDALPTYSTAREAIIFSARLRVPSNTQEDNLLQWVATVIGMVELQDIEDRMIGNALHGGMSFEQRKRVSIAVELAANPSIMFLDEPTTGLDSKSAEVVIRNIRTIANSGRTVVCTIHQPSPSVFFTFDKLLLLQNGGKVVYFGDIGENGSSVINYFATLPNVMPIGLGKNPATWMLECIGAGTSRLNQPQQNGDFKDIFERSELSQKAQIRLDELMISSKDTKDINEIQFINSNVAVTIAPWTLQAIVLLKRTWLSYWRNPGYNLVRILQNVFVSIAFASAYVQYQCENTSDVMALATVLLMTSVSCSILAMMVSVPVAIGERLVFYREQQSKMYGVFLYTAIQTMVEIPYIALASLSFVLPFFFIVGMDRFGDNPVTKFFYYWLFSGLTLAFNVFYGQFLVASLPDHSTAQTFTGLSSSIFALFSGFMIRTSSIPPFWRFVYWANPFHYSLEGVVMTQFHNDETIITLWDGSRVSVATFIAKSFPDWSFDHVPYDILALVLFLLSNCFIRYICLSYFRYEKR